ARKEQIIDDFNDTST
ncbi:unnamed protein product, partial [Rotaria magnacalcarata]